MKTNRLIRDVHYWASIFVALPIMVMIGAGILLMLKKEIDWIQPPTKRGAGLEISADGAIDALSLTELMARARSAKPEAFATWRDVARVDIKPGRDIVKFISENRWEVQLDLKTGDVLQVAYRRSDLIESIHDGSFFASWAKLCIFLPAGLILFGLWGTGLYLFALPQYKKYQKSKKKARLQTANRAKP